MWSDRINDILGKVAQRSALGQRIPESAISAATAGALETEYNRAFSNAASERSIKARQEEQDKTIASNEKLAKESRISAETIADKNFQLNKEALGIQKQGQEDQAVANLTSAIVTGGPKAIEYGAKAYEWLTTPSAVTSNVANYTPGVYSGYEEISSAVGTSTNAMTTATGAIETAPSSASMLDLGVFATEKSLAATTEAATVAMASEAAVASAWQASALTGAGTADVFIGIGEARMAEFLAEEATLMSTAGSALSAVGTVMPFVGVAFMGMSFLAPDVMEPVNEVVTTVVDTVVDTVKTVVDAVVDTVKTVVDAVTDFFSGGGSIVCEELNRQGYLPNDVLADEGLARLKYIDDDVYSGYLFIFKPVVKAMKKSKIVTMIIKPFGIGIAYELASKVNNKRNGSFIGKLCLLIGSPICKIVNKVVK